MANGPTDDFGDYWDCDDDELYELLGAALLGTGAVGISPEEQDRNRRFGKRWFDRQYHELQQRVCTQKTVRDLIGQPTSDRLVDAGTVAGLLAQQDDYGANSVLIAVLITRIGLSAFCANVKPAQ
ncbi:MAG: hypothetical protein ACRDRK_00205 [Pseudonocardia sp.]